MISKTDLKIFIVDDNSICRELYKRYLLNLGFTNITLFDNGPDCIDQLIQYPDVILLDHEMTPLDGMETLKNIKALNPDTFVVYISGQDDLEVAVKALKSGAFDYIIKGNAAEEKRLMDVMNKIMIIIEMLSKKANTGRAKFLSLFAL